MQAFAIGALAFDFTAYIVAPIIGIKMQGIEVDTSNKNNQTSIYPYQNSAIINNKNLQNKIILYQNIKRRWDYDRIQWNIIKRLRKIFNK